MINLTFFRFTPFDTSTEHGRSQERHRRIALTAAVSVMGKALAQLTPLITIPLMLAYLGKANYGIWMMLSSLMLSLTFADLGLGLGLLNTVAACKGPDKEEKIKIYISSAFFVLLGLSVFLLFDFIVFRKYIPWSSLLTGLSAEQSVQIPEIVTVLIICLLLNLVFGVVDRIYAAYQEGFVSGIGQILSSILTLIGLAFAVKMKLSLSGFVIIMSGTPIVMLLFTGGRLFLLRRPWLRPHLDLVRWWAVKELFRSGSMFFVLQICFTFSYNLDNVIIGKIQGLNEVADYAVPARLFAAFASIVPLLLNPIWPAYIEAAREGDVAWVRRTLTRSIKLVLSWTIPANLLLALAGAWIIDVYTHHRLHPDQFLLWSFALWGVVGTLATVTSMFMNAMNVVLYQSIGAILMASLNFGLSIYLTKHIGTTGVVWGSIISQSLMLVPTCFIVIPKILDKLTITAELQKSKEVLVQ